MAQIPQGSGKKFEKPDAGIFIGTIIDAVFLPQVPSKNPQFPEPKDRLRVVWVLDKLDSEGKPFRVMEQPPFRIADGGNNTKKSRLYEIYEGVFQGAIPVPYESEDLIGRSNRLFLAKEGEYTNIKGFMPLLPGDVAPKAPADYVRHKDKKAAGTTAAAKPTTAAAATSTPALAAAAQADSDF